MITINSKGDATNVTSPLFISSAKKASYELSKTVYLP